MQLWTSQSRTKFLTTAGVLKVGFVKTAQMILNHTLEFESDVQAASCSDALLSATDSATMSADAANADATDLKL